MWNTLQLAFFRFAAGGKVPPQWFEPKLPLERDRAAKTGHLTLEVVSHCWNYSHFLVYQLSSLVLFPPKQLDVTMTIFYSPEDTKTVELLTFFEKQQVPGVTWNWQPILKRELFRRSIGRNRAALATKADWVWFTDCDLMFRENCLDSLAECLQGRRDVLLFPVEERTTGLLAEDNPMLSAVNSGLQILDIDVSSFTTRKITKATGPLQIAHGDVCRAVGYCQHINLYQQPVENFAKCHEDRAFRWLLRSQGEPVAVPGVYRIRHIAKGRYNGSGTRSNFRTWLRIWQSRWRDWRQGENA
ncbi:glycosyltransferase family 2 protein [Vreelandella andesensis]|uniref:Glycosyltransferase family 2 protein n=1 Tax=Vreelandella andesensis TaxID=447567 RepID=A0A433KHV8_9GAMM|nr:glycosyltransferase family A protein [Halomonas andesensis]RUR28667.1 glycosyltransferase family 2 protein [Halomonas andesensis]